jgi:hypothetical protein
LSIISELADILTAGRQDFDEFSSPTPPDNLPQDKNTAVPNPFTILTVS